MAKNAVEFHSQNLNQKLSYGSVKDTSDRILELNKVGTECANIFTLEITSKADHDCVHSLTPTDSVFTL